MPRFTRAELESYRDAEVPDLIGSGVRLLFVGINPGLWTAATRTHFAHPANRFYPALERAGILERPVASRGGDDEETQEVLRARGLGITNLVPRATARADELSAEELAAGAERLTALVARTRPRVVAVLGITAYRQAFGRRKAVGRAAARGDRRRRALGPAQPLGAQRPPDRRHPGRGVRRARARRRPALTPVPGRAGPRRAGPGPERSPVESRGARALLCTSAPRASRGPAPSGHDHPRSRAPADRWRSPAAAPPWRSGTGAARSPGPCRDVRPTPTSLPPRCGCCCSPRTAAPRGWWS